jgi:Na+/proline symporter
VTLSAISVHFFGRRSIVEQAIAVIGFFSGPLLGMFLLGMFSLRANSIGAIFGALLGFATVLLLALFGHISIMWYPVVGCLSTMIYGLALSYFAPPESHEKVYPMTVWGRDKKWQRLKSQL